MRGGPTALGADERHGGEGMRQVDAAVIRSTKQERKKSL